MSISFLPLVHLWMLIFKGFAIQDGIYVMMQVSRFAKEITSLIYFFELNKRRLNFIAIRITIERWKVQGFELKKYFPFSTVI